MDDARLNNEMIRKVTEQVLARFAEASSSGKTSGDESCYCGCGGKTFTEIAEKEGQCCIYTDPSHERTLAAGYIPIGISARHVHLSVENVEILFGKGHRLTPIKDLRQPGQFAAKETVSIIGPRGRSLENIRVLGPARTDTQVEISLTDCIYTGIKAPVRPSGNHHQTPGCIIVGPKGHLVIDKGVIRANRHIHLQTREAQGLGLRDNDIVMVKIEGDKPALYYEVQIRVRDNFVAEMHLDTDDANAIGLDKKATARIIRRAEDIILCGKLV